MPRISILVALVLLVFAVPGNLACTDDAPRTSSEASDDMDMDASPSVDEPDSDASVNEE